MRNRAITRTPIATFNVPPNPPAVFAHPQTGEPLGWRLMYERLRASLQAAGLDVGFGFHSLRHSYGTALAAQADEVFQDTWLKVVTSRDRWAPQGATFRTWLFTLAHHRVIDLLRRSGREVALDAFEGEGDEPWQPETTAWQHWPPPASAALQSEDLAFWRKAGEKLLHCLEQLPLPQRSAFLLHHDDGLALEEVARALEVGFETAKTRLRYAMSKLRICMGAYLEPLQPGRPS